MNVIKVIFLFMIAYIAAQFIIAEIREIIFYGNRKWDFDLHSDVGLKAFHGDSNRKEDDVGNKYRVIYYTPLAILGLILMAVILIYS